MNRLIFIRIIDQYKAAGISPWNNTWGNIHDFTSIPDSKNYSLLDQVRFLFNSNFYFIDLFWKLEWESI
jgi:hypothetical protein